MALNILRRLWSAIMLLCLGLMTTFFGWMLLFSLSMVGEKLGHLWTEIAAWLTQFSRVASTLIVVGGGIAIACLLLLFLAAVGALFADELANGWADYKRMLSKHWYGVRGLPSLPRHEPPSEPEFVPREGNFFQRNAGWFWTGVCIAMAHIIPTELRTGTLFSPTTLMLAPPLAALFGVFTAGLAELQARRQAAKSRRLQLSQDRRSQSPLPKASQSHALGSAVISEAPSDAPASRDQ